MSDTNLPPESQGQPEQTDRPRSIRQHRNRPPHKPDRVPALSQNDDLNFASRLRYDKDLDRDLEQALQEAMSGVSNEELGEVLGQGGKRQQSAEPLADKPIASGAKQGKVISVRGKDVFVDVGGRVQGFLPVNQFEQGPPAPGTVVECFIEGYDPDGLLILSRRGAAVEADWSSVAVGMIVEARVTATNTGGLTVDVNGIRGFMPISQIELFRVEDLAPYVNQRLRCMVVEVDREDRNLIVSRRALLEKERAEAGAKLWQELAEGQVREGIVRQVKPFGAFIDLGGADGLLPIGEMSWQRIQSPEEIVQPGQKVRVVILRIDRDARKLTLGLKQLSESPWDRAALNYPPGATVRAKVTRLADFGAFAEVEPGVEGLIHISELAPQRVNRVADVVKVGEEVTVRVLSLDSAARRLALSLKQAAKAPEPESEEEEDESLPPLPPRKAIPLRGGVGNKLIDLPMPDDEQA